MKTYINPNTILMIIEAQALICAGSPTGGNNGDDPANARTPMHKINGLYC